MSPTPAHSPFSYPLVVTDVPATGLDVFVEADARERAEIAADFKLPGVATLAGRFHIGHTSLGLRVTGRVTARVTQTCSISLEPFESDVDEEVEVDFANAAHLPPVDPGDGPMADDPPDPIINGKIDLGALTAEFLALGLDPYPRKPGVEFAFDDAAGEAALSPFARLAALKGAGKDK